MFRAFSENSENPDKGFQMTFENGLTISVMFGKGNYCDRRYDPRPGGSETAEIAVWRNDKSGYLFADGTTPQSNAGWKTPEEVAAAINLVSQAPTDITQKQMVEQMHGVFNSLTPA